MKNKSSKRGQGANSNGDSRCVQRRVRPLRLKVTQAQMSELKLLKQPARAIDYSRIIGHNKAAMLVSANFHGRPVEAIVA